MEKSGERLKVKWKKSGERLKVKWKSLEKFWMYNGKVGRTS